MRPGRRIELTRHALPTLEGLGHRHCNFDPVAPHYLPVETQLDRSFSNERKIPRLPAPEHLHARCARKIGRHIARVLGTDDEAEDLAQEVLVTLFTSLGTLRDPALFDAWVAQITKNKALHVLRQRSLRRRVLENWQTHHDPTLEVDLDGRIVAARAVAVLDQLSPNQRALLTAYWFTPGNVKDIAARRGCSVSTVRRQLDRARRRFEKLARRDATLARFYAAD